MQQKINLKVICLQIEKTTEAKPYRVNLRSPLPRIHYYQNKWLQVKESVRDRALGPLFYRMLGQTHVNGWSRVIASQNGGSSSYIFPLRLGVLQWSRHLFNYWKNKKTIIEKFLILLI